MSYANVLRPGSRGHSESGTSLPRRNHLTLPLSDQMRTAGNEPYCTSRIAVAVRLVSKRLARLHAESMVIDRLLLARSNMDRGSNKSAAYSLARVSTFDPPESSNANPDSGLQNATPESRSQCASSWAAENRSRPRLSLGFTV